MRAGTLVVMLLVPLSGGFVLRHGDTSGRLTREERQEIVWGPRPGVQTASEGRPERLPDER